MHFLEKCKYIESLVKACCKLSVKLSLGIANFPESFTETFKAGLQVYCKLSRLDCKFDAKLSGVD